ncbi:MAG: BrnT family toxin [Candidatus Latescibacteria bacterium]|jgi:uncharacterized protein|nr:BrnT family toxin [Candidatus Latescibacterota bacterium]MBT4136394.1 BrnT family toxin [Candidatus Latescibacterota bacterium]
MARFEFDEDKSKANQEKHGIDFLVAQELWEDTDLLEIQAKSNDELRFLVIGIIGAIHWSAVITYRNESIRLISVRRARKKEIALYES